MKIKGYTIVAAAAASAVIVLSGCAASMHNMTVDAIHAREGQAIRQWEAGNGDTFLITQQGLTYTKWRVFDWSVGMSKGTQAEVLGKVDTQLEACFAGTGGLNRIECHKLANDVDLAPYITWLSDPAPAFAGDGAER